jgi:hypothetical protein
VIGFTRMNKLTQKCLDQIFEYGFTLQSLGILSQDEDQQLYNAAVDKY